MKFIKFLIIIFITLNINSLNAQSENLSNKITKNLRCLICQGQSIYDSDSEFAKIRPKFNRLDCYIIIYIYTLIFDIYFQFAKNT